MSARFDLAMLACCAAMVLGGYVLAWASDRGLTWRADSVFSPWAALLYAGFLPAAYLLLTVAAGSPGPTIRARAPEGYEAATVGSVLFIAGVVLSLLIPGEDFPLAGLVSPQTLLMFLGGMLLVSGPLVSLGRRWRERDPDLDRRGTGLSFAVALGLLLAVLTLLTSFAHPFSLDLTVAARTSPATAAQTDLYLLPLDGSGGRRLTVTPDAYEANPAVSPDGSRVAFSRGVPATFDLYTVRLDGSDERRLTQAPGDDNGATWSPTGQAIAFWGSPRRPARLPASLPVRPRPLALSMRRSPDAREPASGSPRRTERARPCCRGQMAATGRNHGHGTGSGCAAGPSAMATSRSTPGPPTAATPSGSPPTRPRTGGAAGPPMVVVSPSIRSAAGTGTSGPCDPMGPTCVG